MYFPRNWEFGSALSKLRNFEGGLNPPNTPPWYAAALTQHESRIINVKNMYIDSHKYYRVNKKKMYIKNVFNATK
jgi:hypothetical protein